MKNLTKILVLVLITFTQNSLFSQTDNEIIYYDFVPDTSIVHLRYGPYVPSDTLKLDFNRDNIKDVEFYFVRTQIFTSYRINSLNTDWKICYMHSDTLTNILEEHWLSNYIWNYDVLTDENFGVRYSHGEDFYYGWFRAYITHEDSVKYIVVDKTAFCTIPNYDLVWGQTDTSGINITDSTDTTLFLKNINTGNLLVYYPNGIIGEVEIINSSGQLINNRNNINSDYTEIDITSLQSGMYIVRATLVDNTVVIGKFVK